MQIDPARLAPSNTPLQKTRAAQNSVFRLEMRHGDRINGSIPVFGAARTPDEEIQAGLTGAAKNASPLPPAANSLAETAAKDDDSFGFLDLIDVVNPLQHIPLVGSLYRKLTGDEIKPVSRIVGGAAFGGPLGAASGIVNAVAQWGTGKDVAENIIDPAAAPAPAKHDTTIALANLAADNSRYNS